MVTHGGRAVRVVTDRHAGVGGGGVRTPVLCHQDTSPERRLLTDPTGGRHGWCDGRSQGRAKALCLLRERGRNPPPSRRQIFALSLSA